MISVLLITAMTDELDDAALLTLATWLSPGFPIGAFTYSHGLETAVAEGTVSTAGETRDWVATCLIHGAGRTDAIFLAQAWRAVVVGDREALRAAAELAGVFAPSAERRLETLAQGTAFLRVAREVWPVEGLAADSPAETAYPVAVGAMAAARECPLRQTTLLYLNAFAANLISAAVRLVPLGQTDGQAALAALRPCILAVATAALSADLDDIGGFALGADLASLRHETQPTRLFRS